MSCDLVKVLGALEKLSIEYRDYVVKSMSPNRNLTASYVNQDIKQAIYSITNARLDVARPSDIATSKNLSFMKNNKSNNVALTKASLINNIYHAIQIITG